MESGNGGAWSEGVLVPVAAGSDVFQNNVLAPLKSAYLYEESKQSFRYKSAVLIKNPALEEKYNAFRAQRREAGYSEEDLKESYGFLLFDDLSQANALGETGVLTGNSTCTTLGDPSKGVYISVYSDCLDLNRWYHGKSGYIAIIRLTKGRVNKVLENYTQNFTAPTEGFDCHVSEQLPSVSAKTSSFLAFERTQYYVYELLDDGGKETAQSPSAACPFAIVSFSYTDTKATLVVPQEESEEKKTDCNYFPWRGQFQIGTHIYDFGLRSTEGATIPAELPAVVKVDRAISMLELRQLLPRAVFETSFSGEVFLDGLYCSLCELVSSEAEQSISFSLLLREIKEKDVALIILLNDGGFLILLHSSHFFTYDDSGSSESEVLQGMFVFPDSRVIQRETKFGQRKHAMSSEILRVLPVLSYAEGEVEKTPIEPREDLCEVFAQHMQSYAALINPGLALSPSRDFNIFPDQYDVPDAHKHLYVSPEWTNRSWQNFRSYLNKPVSFQLPVSKASEILATGQEELIADLDDDVYFCPSSPEEPLSNHVGMTSEAQLREQRTAVNVESFVDSCIKNVEGQVDLTAVPQVVAPDDLQPGGATKDSEKSDLTVLIKTDGMGTKNLLSPSKSDDLPAELIVSITSAEQTVTNASLSVISTESTIKHNDFQLSGFSTAKFETVGVNSLNDEIVKTKKVFDCPELTNLPKRKCRKPHRGFTRGRKHVSKACIDTPSLETVETPVKDENLKSQKEDQAKKLSSKPQLNNSSNSDWRKMRRQKLKFGSLENKKLRSATVDLAVAEQKTWTAGQQFFKSTILMELEAGPLRKKTERWDLKPVISECGRILVPHGSVDIADQIKTLKDKLQSTKDEPCPEKMSDDASVNTHDTFQMEQESSTAPETAVDKTEATTSQTGGNHSQNVIVSHVNPKHNILRQSDDRNGSLALNPERSEHSLKDDGTDTPPLETVQEKHNDTASPGKCATKGEFLLKKLRSVLRRKRKTGILVSEETTADTAQDTEPCLKKGKVDLDSVMLKSNDEMTIVQDTNLGVKEVSKMLSVDPLFAYALGLTPKETPDKIQKSDRQDTEQRKDSSEPQDQTILDKQPQIIQRPLSIFPRRGRIKTLKKHQGISAEHVKKKWWLHFQTPACFASEKLKYKERTRDNSVRKTVKDKNNSACSSTDALNLLADLALSANNDQVPLKPDPAKRKPETSLKKCDHTKDVTSGEQESVLHALLRQPAARPILPLESPSPSHLVGGSELVGLISKEHAYSLPPSSSLLLDLSGTSFQVSPLSGSTRLLHHHQTMCGDGIKTLHPSVDQEDISEQNHRTPEYLKKHMVCRRKFRNSRTFVTKDGSVQVTKQWKENYDFNLDSKFMSDSKDKAIIRALHGPWDFSIQDTSEEVRLIVHMWIGLFYSRSTARFFHFDSNLTNQSSENCDSLDISSGMLSAPAQSEHKDNSFAPNPTVPNTSDTLISKALDLSKKDNSVLDQGSVILDLSLRNSNTETVTSDQQVDKEETPVSGEQTGASETLNTLKSSMGLQKTSTLQCYRNSIHSTEIISEVTDVRRHYEGERTCTPCQEVGCMEHADEPSSEDGGTFISVEGDTERVSCQLENQQTASGAGHVLHGCYNEKTDVKDDIDDSEATKMSLVQKQERHLSKSVIDKEADSSKKADNVDSTFVHEEIESKDGGNWEIKERPYQEGNEEVSPKVIHAGDDSANEKSDVVCNGNLLKSEKQLSSEEPKAVSPGEAGNVNEDAECCAAHEEKVIKDDHFRKDVLDEKDNCTSNVEADSDLIDQPLPKLCDGPESVKTDCIPEWNGQARLNEQLPQAHYEEDACPDMQLKKLCANSSALTDESAISVEASHALSGIEPVCNEPIIEKNSENSICLVSKAHNQKAALPFSDKRTCLLYGSSADGSVPQTSDSVETGSQNKVMTNFNPRGDDHEDWDTKLVKEEQNADNTAQEELLYHQSHSPQCMAVTKFKSEGTLNKETDLKNDNRNEGLEKICCQVVIPFIGVDTSGDDASQSEGKVEVQEQIETSFVSENTCSETVLPTEVGSTSQMYSKDAELSTGKISLSLLDIRKNNQLEVSGSESDDRCPTPTIDEEPYQYVTISGPSGSGSSAFSSSEAFKNMNQKYVSKSSTFLKDKMLLVQKHKCKVNCDSTPPHGLHPDLEQRTLRVLQSIDKFLSSSSHTDKSSQIKTVDIKPSLDQQDKLLEISLGPDCHLHRSFPSTECLQAIKPNPDQDRQKTTSQTNLSHEPRSHSQRPVMAVKPSKSDEIQADCMSKDREIENSVISCFSKNQKTKTLVHTFSTPASMLLENNARLKGNFTGLNDDKQEASQNSSESAWLSNVSDVKSHSDQAKFAVLDPLYHYKRSDTSEFTKIPLSSLPTSSKHVGGSQNFFTKCSVEKIGQTTKESIGINQNDCSDASTSVGDSKDDGIIDDSLFLDPQSSLTCTVYNTSQKRSSSFLEQLSQRCLQDNLTQASVEQECLIFSEQMKQLLKRSKRGPIHQLDEQDNLNLSCSGPVTVHFSSLDEREDSVDHMNVPSLVGLKIKVDMSDRKDLADTTEKDNTYHPQKLSQGTENPVEHTGVFGVTAECARLYSAMMNDVCAVKKVPSRPKQFRMDRGYPKTEPSNHFDFYDQMKREMDESFRSHLNSVVKKCCKTKYRFYILVTSDDSFFEETKVQLEAEGHTTLQPSEFFCGEDSSSSLLIILRNEDIAEYICKIPHLLKLKKSPDVQFAGIDEPDDVVNLTHQELFIRGGFIMFDRASLESLSLCNMKKMSDILLELSRTGKWKWMLHYRDSRRLKENARLSAEAKEKKHFLNWCQDVGILEVLPYHECDLMSRDQPDYLTCLVRLQVQNISARYPVFITDTTTDSAFGTNGILTMTLKSFLTCSPSKTFMT